MHDPSFLALTIYSPIPRREAWSDRFAQKRWTLGRSRRTNDENLGEPTYPWWNLGGYRPVIAGRCFRFPHLIDVWHDEPGGRDSGEVCKYPHGWELRHHLSHLHVRVIPLGRLRRWALTRCSWCGGRSRKGDYVNCSMAWDGPTGKWWQGEPGLFHSDCSGIYTAYRACTCETPKLAEGRDYGRCLTCDRHRTWRLEESARQAYLLQRQVGRHKRPTPEQKERIAEAWLRFRNERDALEKAEEVIEAAHKAVRNDTSEGGAA